MIKTNLRRLVALTATTALAASLAACGPDDAPQNHTVAPLLSQAAPQSGWSMADLAGVDPAFLGDEAAPLPPALPMQASYRGGYDYAPAYDYGPDSYDENYYADDAESGDYQWLALASALSGMLGDAPPDYAFGYDGVQPWAWETGDRYLRYAEPLDGGYRYYYYEPDSYTPFLVSDPYYSYGYRGDRLVAIYDRSGRVIDVRRAERQRQAAHDYYARAGQMYLAAHQARHRGVAAPLWQRHREDIARQPRQWDQARGQRPAWQRWDAQNEQRLHRDWAGEALVRREAERGFAGWQKAAFKTPAPKFYSPQQRRAQAQKVAEIRHEAQVADARGGQQRRAANQRDGARQPRMNHDQRVAAAGLSQQGQRRVDAVGAREKHQAQAHLAGQRRQAEAKAQNQLRSHKLAEVRKMPAPRAIAPKPVQAKADLQTRPRQEHARQQASREAQQRQQAAAHRGQERKQAAAQQAAQREQAFRANAERRQQAAREHQLEAQPARQNEARQAQRAVQQKQAPARQAAQREARQPHAAQPKAPAGQPQQTHADARPGKGHGRKGD